MALSAGTRLGPYEILAPIGAGGMGEVFRATDTRLHRTVAIKILPRDKVADPERKKRFLQEARAASALNHPNIVTLYDIASDGGVDYLVMEYVPGRPLNKMITPKGLPLAEAARYTAQISGALAVAHAAGIVHRDMKPANVIVTTESQVKILDFGLAKLTARTPGPESETVTLESALTETGVVMGTVAYMSPEQASSQPLDHRTDIFSLGVMLFEMIVGERPFRGRSHVETMNAIINTPAPPINRSPELQEIVDKALAKDPKERYQHAGDLGIDLRRFQRALELKTLPSTSAARSAKSVGWVAALILSLVALGAGWWAGYRGQAQVPSLADTMIAPFTTNLGYNGDPTISPEGQTVAYVSDRAGRFDIFLRQVGTTADVALTNNQGDNIQPSYSPDGRQIAFVSTRAGGSDISHACCDQPLTGGDIWVMPALGGSARMIVKNGNKPSWSPDGSTIIFARVRDGIYQVPATGGDALKLALENEAAILRGTSPIYTSDGRWIFFEAGTNQGGNIYVVSATGGAPTFIAQGWHPAWDGVSQAIVFSNRAEGRNNSLWEQPFSLESGRPSGSPRPLTVGRGRDSQPAVSRDGKLIAYTALDVTFNLELALFDAEAGRVLGLAKALTTGNQIIYFQRFSPDGRSVVFQSTRGGGTHIWRLDFGAEAVPLTSDSKFEDTYPAWSPDGNMIAFDRAQGSTPASLWLMAPDGANPRRIADISQNNSRWLPNGSGIVYAGKDAQYYLYDLSSGQSRQITNEKGIGGMPAVSPDGKWLTYQFQVGGNIDVHATPMAGGSARTIVSTRKQDYHPFFSPSGKWMYFQPDHKNLYRVPGPAQDWKSAEPQKITDFPEPAGLFLEDPQISQDGSNCSTRVAGSLVTFGF